MIHRPFCVSSCLVLATGALVINAAALSGQQRVMVLDEGEGPMVLHFSGPDLESLRQPDFALGDLPLFVRDLALSSAQEEAVRSLLIAYLEKFSSQVAEHLGVDSKRNAAIGLGPVRLSGDEDGAEALFLPALDHELPDADLEMMGPGTIQIAITVGDDLIVAEDADVVVGDGELDAPDAAVESGVTIEVDTPDGVEIPEEVRKALEAHAQEMVERIQKQMEDLGEARANGRGDPGLPMVDRMEEQRQLLEERAARGEEFKQVKAALRAALLRDVQALLASEQLERWPKLERSLTRVKTLPRGRLDGERLDLISMIDDQELTAEQQEALAETLLSYELQLDAVLERRNAYLEDADRRVDEAMQEGAAEKALQVLDRAARLRVAVRETNLRSAESIAEELDSDSASQWRERVRETAFPRVYRSTRAQKAFDALTKLDDLDPETMGAIEELGVAYAAELERMNLELCEIICRQQPEEPKTQILNVAAIMQGDEPPAPRDLEDPTRDAFRRRGELDEGYLKRLRSLLPPERVAALPELQPRRLHSPLIIERSAAPK